MKSDSPTRQQHGLITHHPRLLRYPVEAVESASPRNSSPGDHDLLHSESRREGGDTHPRLLYSMTRAPRTAIPSEPTEPMVAAPAVLEALALAPVALPVLPDDSEDVAVDEPSVGVAVRVVVESVVGRREAVAVTSVDEPEGAAVPLVLPALADSQLSPALMAEQKALAAGRTSSALVVNTRAPTYDMTHGTISSRRGDTYSGRSARHMQRARRWWRWL